MIDEGRTTIRGNNDNQMVAGVKEDKGDDRDLTRDDEGQDEHDGKKKLVRRSADPKRVLSS
jgi:hypothetical protein